MKEKLYCFLLLLKDLICSDKFTVPSTVIYSYWLKIAESRWSATSQKIKRPTFGGVEIVWESLDHLLLIHLRVICAFLRLTSDLSQALWSPIHTAGKGAAQGKGRGEGSGEGVETEGTFSSGCFLWFRVWVNVSKPQGLAGPSLANTGGQARYLCPTDR